MANYAGGYKVFGPTYNSTKYVRFGHEGTVNSMHNIDPELIPEDPSLIDVVGAEKTQLAGKIAMIKATDDGDSVVTVCTDPSKACGLFVDDLGDIVNASNKASFYFRGGEYFISLNRMGTGADTIVPGDTLTCDSEGKLIKGSTNVIAVATTAPEVFTTGNMYENAGAEANGGLFVGISLKF